MSRWIRLDTTWSQSEWLSELEPECRLVWVELLCYAKAHGTDGRVRAGNANLQRVTGVTRYAVDKLVTAAIEHGSLELQDGFWVLTGWKKYQGDPTGKDRQKRYRQARQQLNSSEEEESVTGVTRYAPLVTPTVTETLTNKERESARPSRNGKRRSHRLPPDWQPTQQHISAAAERGLDVGREATKFRTHAEATGRKLESWNAGFSQWLIRAEEFTSDRQKPKERPMYRKASEVLW
jgi:hypothetical protein